MPPFDKTRPHCSESSDTGSSAKLCKHQVKDWEAFVKARCISDRNWAGVEQIRPGVARDRPIRGGDFGASSMPFSILGPTQGGGPFRSAYRLASRRRCPRGASTGRPEGRGWGVDQRPKLRPETAPLKATGSGVSRETRGSARKPVWEVSRVRPEIRRSHGPAQSWPEARA